MRTIHSALNLTFEHLPVAYITIVRCRRDIWSRASPVIHGRLFVTCVPYGSVYIDIDQWLNNYFIRRLADLQGDLLAGFTIGLTVIPQSIAYAGLAGLAPQVGLLENSCYELGPHYAAQHYLCTNWSHSSNVGQMLYREPGQKRITKMYHPSLTYAPDLACWNRTVAMEVTNGFIRLKCYRKVPPVKIYHKVSFYGVFRMSAIPDSDHTQWIYMFISIIIGQCIEICRIILWRQSGALRVHCVLVYRVKWRSFIFYNAPKLERLMLNIYRHKSDQIKLGMNEMKVNDSYMSIRRNNEAWSIPEKSALREPIVEYRLRRKRTMKEVNFYLFKKKRSWKITH